MGVEMSNYDGPANRWEYSIVAISITLNHQRETPPATPTAARTRIVLRDRVTGDTQEVPIVLDDGAGAISYKNDNTPDVLYNCSGLPWTLQDLDNLQLFIYSGCAINMQLHRFASALINVYLIENVQVDMIIDPMVTNGQEPTIRIRTNLYGTEFVDGYHIKVFSTQNAPFTTYTDPGNTDVSGYTGDIYDSGPVFSSAVVLNPQITINMRDTGGSSATYPDTSYVFLRVHSRHTGWSRWGYELMVPTAAVANRPVITSVTPDNVNNRYSILVAMRGNMLSQMQHDFDRPLISLQGWYAKTNCSVALANTGYSGNLIDSTAHCLQMTSTAAGDMKACTSEGTQGIPVNPTTNYRALATFNAVGAARVCRLDLEWFDSTGALIQTDTGTNTATDSSWTSIIPGTAGATNAVRIQTAAPANAAFMAVIAVVVGPTAGGEIHYVDYVHVAPGGAEFSGTGGAMGARNMLTANQASLETDTTGWELVNYYPFTGGAAAATMTRDTTQHLDGIASLKVSRTNALACGATTPPGRRGISVVPGRTYTALMYMGNAGLADYGQIIICWYDTNGNPLSQSQGPITTCASFWVKTFVTAVAPANAYWAAIQVTIQNGRTGTAFFFDCISFIHGSVQEWSPGTNDWFQSHLQLERSEDSGTTWTPLFNSAGVHTSKFGNLGEYNPLTGQITVLDYCATPKSTVIYRGAVVVNQRMASGIGAIFGSDVSDWSSPTTLSIPVTQGWWLKNPATPSQNMVIEVVGDSGEYDYTSPEDSATFHPIGRPNNVVVTDVLRGTQIQLVLDCIDDATFAGVMTLRSSLQPLLLQNCWTGKQWWVRIVDATVKEMNTTPVRREVTVSMEQVDAPTV
jgi:hypothetical protein